MWEVFDEYNHGRQHFANLHSLSERIRGAFFVAPCPGTQHTRKSFYVILAARGGSATGHAFVLWGIEDHIRRRTTIQAFGLYPDGSRGNCSTLVRTVPGGIADEMKNHSFQAITEELIVRVDEAEFKRSWTVARQWDCRHEFSMFNRDCVDFVRAVGESLHLNMPRRAITQWTPQAYVRALVKSPPPSICARPIAERR
jgi:hypothetical protein